MGRLTRTDKSENGVSAVELLVVIVAILVICVVGWKIYRNHHKKTSSQISSIQVTVAPPINNSVSSTVSSSTQYLRIKQLGIELPLTSGIQDLFYSYLLNDHADSTPGSTLSFSTASLDNQFPACKPSSTQDVGSGFGIVYVKTLPLPSYDLYPVDSTDLGSNGSPALFSHVNGYYLYWLGPQSNCLQSQSTSGAVSQSSQDTYTQELNAFKASLKSAQAIN